MYKLGAQIIRKPPSPFAYLLAGLGQGAESAMARALREKERQKSLVTQILENVATGQIDQSWFATPEAQNLLRVTKVSTHPEIQELISKGQEMALESGGRITKTPSGAAVRMPGQYSLAQYAEERRRKESLRKLREFAEVEAPIHEAKKRIEQQIKEERIPEVSEAMRKVKDLAKSQGLEVGNITYDPETGKIHVDYVTSYEKQKDILGREDKIATAKDKYNSKITDAVKYKADSTKYLTGIKRGDEINTVDLLLLLKDLLNEKNIDILARKTALMKPEDRAKLLTREFNNVLESKNKEISDLGKRAGVQEFDIFKIENIDEKLLEDEEEDLIGGRIGETFKKVPSNADLRGTIKVPKSKQPPTSEEIEVKAQEYMKYGLIDEAGRPLNIEQARVLAKKRLSQR